jgi:hypothetical protein
MMLGFGWLATLLYIDAAVSPAMLLNEARICT